MNGQRVKQYFGVPEEVNVFEFLYLDEVWVIKVPESWCDNKSGAIWEATQNCCTCIYFNFVFWFDVFERDAKCEETGVEKHNLENDDIDSDEPSWPWRSIISTIGHDDVSVHAS